MRAVIARERAAGVNGLAPADMPYPQAAENDVIIRVHAALSLEKAPTAFDPTRRKHGKPFVPEGAWDNI